MSSISACKSLIQKLVTIPAPSGYEGTVRQVIQAEVMDLFAVAEQAGRIHTDTLGNLIVRIGPQGNEVRKILLSAHMDEIGVIATHIDEKGFVRFMNIGGVSPLHCPGRRVRFLNGSRGVIGMEYLPDPARRPGFDDLFIDLGVKNRKECPVRVGDMAVFEGDCMELGDRLICKACDDRVGVAILLETLRDLLPFATQLPHEVLFVFSVQEEVGNRGAAAAAYHLAPDIGLAVDVTSAGDTPRGIPIEVTLGKGPAIKVRDQNMLADPRLVRWMASTAEAEHIPYQMEILIRGSTDAAVIQVSRSGVLSGCLSIPCRYVHSPSEMLDVQDVYQAVRLLVALMKQPAPWKSWM